MADTFDAGTKSTVQKIPLLKVSEFASRRASRNNPANPGFRTVKPAVPEENTPGQKSSRETPR